MQIYLLFLLCLHVVQRDKFVNGVKNMEAMSTDQITGSSGLSAWRSQIKTWICLRIIIFQYALFC